MFSDPRRPSFQIAVRKAEILAWHTLRDSDPEPAPVDPLKPLSDQLPEMPRLIYRMVDVEKFSEKEVAGVTAMPAAKVRRALARAREMLKARLA